MPIVALFYNENGLNEFDIYLLQAVYSISVAVMEIPSGYMADIFGRKKTMILGAVLGTCGFAAYSVSYDFTGFLIAEIVLGLGGSFISGSDSALLYDSLAARNKQHHYLQFEGRVTSLGNFAETVAAICGGGIAALLSYRSVYLAQTFIAALAIPATLYLLEPPRSIKIDRPGLNHILHVCRRALYIEKNLSSTIFLSAITGVATLCMAWTAQIYFISINFSEIEITPLWVTLNLTVALVAAYAASVVKALGQRYALLLIIIYIPLAYVTLGLLPVTYAIISLYLFYAVRGYATPVLKDLINQNCCSSIRATVLSIRNLIIRLGFALLGPAIGFFSGIADLSTALVIAGLSLFFLSSVTGLFLFKHHPVSVPPQNSQK